MFISPECSSTLLGLSWLHLVLRFPKGAKTRDSHSKALARFLTWIPPLFSFFPFLFLWLENILFSSFLFFSWFAGESFLFFFLSFSFPDWLENVCADTCPSPLKFSQVKVAPKMKEPGGRGFRNLCHHSCTPHPPLLFSTPSPPSPPKGKRAPLPSSLIFALCAAGPFLETRWGTLWSLPRCRSAAHHRSPSPWHHCQHSGSLLVGLEQLWGGSPSRETFSVPEYLSPTGASEKLTCRRIAYKAW